MSQNLVGTSLCDLVGMICSSSLTDEELGLALSAQNLSGTRRPPSPKSLNVPTALKHPLLFFCCFTDQIFCWFNFFCFFYKSEKYHRNVSLRKNLHPLINSTQQNLDRPLFKNKNSFRFITILFACLFVLNFSKFFLFSNFEKICKCFVLWCLYLGRIWIGNSKSAARHFFSILVRQNRTVQLDLTCYHIDKTKA